MQQNNTHEHELKDFDFLPELEIEIFMRIPAFYFSPAASAYTW